MPKAYKTFNTYLITPILIVILVSSLFFSGCKKDSKAKTDNRRTSALRRYTSGNQRAPVPSCGNNIKCAKKGEGCKFLARADEPADCSKPPTIICECPANKTCVLTTTGTDDWKCISNMVLENQSVSKK